MILSLLVYSCNSNISSTAISNGRKELSLYCMVMQIFLNDLHILFMLLRGSQNTKLGLVADNF